MVSLDRQVCDGLACTMYLTEGQWDDSGLLMLQCANRKQARGTDSQYVITSIQCDVEYKERNK